MRFLFVYEKATEQEVARLVAGVEDMRRPPTRAEERSVANAIRAQYKRAFEGQGTIGGAKWARLAPATVKDRERRGYPGTRPILIRTGTYRRSWTDQFSPDHVQDLQVTPGGGWQLAVGSADYRAKWHEKGTTRMPARPVRIGMDRQAIGVVGAIERIYDGRWPGGRK